MPREKPLWNWIWKLQCPKKIQLFIWKAMRNQVPTRQYLAFSRPHISDHCPRCNIPETTIHILRDCPWAKEVWCQSSGSLPLTFFQLPLQSWLQTNATGKAVILHQQLPRKICFPFLCWHLWLAQNKRIFHNQSRSQHRLIYKTVQAAIEFFYLAGPNKPIQSKVSQTKIGRAHV